MIRANATDAFAIEIDAGRSVSSIRLENITPRLRGPAPTPIAFRDDGQAPDRVAGDFVYAAGPFRYNTGYPMPANYLNDPNSPAGLDSVAVGQIVIVMTDSTTSRFLIGPSVGILRNDLPNATSRVLTSDLVACSHLVNIRSTTRDTQQFLRATGGDLKRLSTVLYSRIPDNADFLFLFSLDKLEQENWLDTHNFAAGRHQTVRVDATGTGPPLSDATASYGSGGSLLGINALDAGTRGTNGITAVHELLHQWAFYGPAALGLDDGESHYTSRSSAGSTLGGQRWTGGVSTWTLDCTEGANGAYHAAPIDLYFMGLLDASSVPPIRVYNDASPPPLRRCGTVISDVARAVTISNIQSVMGVRTPGPATARRSFRVLFAAETNNRLMTSTELTYFEILAAHFAKRLAPAVPDPYVGFNWPSVTRFFGTAVTWTSAVPSYADIDGDGDVDGVDFGRFATCFNGTGNPIRANCARVDFDRNGSIDGIDYALFASCFNGSGNPPTERLGCVAP